MKTISFVDACGRRWKLAQISEESFALIVYGQGQTTPGASLSFGIEELHTLRQALGWLIETMGGK